MLRQIQNYSKLIQLASSRFKDIMSLVVTEMYAVNCFVIPFENESTTTLFNSVPHLLNEKYYNRKRKLMTKRYQTEVLALFYIMKG